MNILQTALYTFPTQENLSNNQEFLETVIISSILSALKFDSGVILLGEIRCLSLLGVKWLNGICCHHV